MPTPESQVRAAVEAVAHWVNEQSGNILASLAADNRPDLVAELHQLLTAWAKARWKPKPIVRVPSTGAVPIPSANFIGGPVPAIDPVVALPLNGEMTTIEVVRLHIYHAHEQHRAQALLAKWGFKVTVTEIRRTRAPLSWLVEASRTLEKGIISL